jgi:hypothetical protein
MVTKGAVSEDSSVSPHVYTPIIDRDEAGFESGFIDAAKAEGNALLTALSCGMGLPGEVYSENRGREVLAFSQSARWMKTKDGKCCKAVAASAVRDADGSVLVKAVNCSEEPQPISISIAGGKVSKAGKTWFTGPGARASNSPLAREALGELSGEAAVRDGAVVETLPPLSLTVFRIVR